MRFEGVWLAKKPYCRAVPDSPTALKILGRTAMHVWDIHVY